jgi:hypothetical protein
MKTATEKAMEEVITINISVSTAVKISAKLPLH